MTLRKETERANRGWCPQTNSECSLVISAFQSLALKTVVSPPRFTCHCLPRALPDFHFGISYLPIPEEILGASVLPSRGTIAHTLTLTQFLKPEASGLPGPHLPPCTPASKSLPAASDRKPPPRALLTPATVPLLSSSRFSENSLWEEISHITPAHHTRGKGVSCVLPPSLMASNPTPTGVTRLPGHSLAPPLHTSHLCVRQ